MSLEEVNPQLRVSGMSLEEVILAPAENLRTAGTIGHVDCGPIVPQGSASAFAAALREESPGAPVGLGPPSPESTSSANSSGLGPPSPESTSSATSSAEGPREAATTSDGRIGPSLSGCSFSGRETRIILDFDDTLFPTTWASSMALRHKSSTQKQDLEEFVEEATNILRCACCLADSVIISCTADRKWVEGALSAVPRLLSEIEQLHVPVLCAGEEDAMRNACAANLIAISPSKPCAIGDAETKVVHMLVEPTLEELVEELRVLGTRLPRLAKKRYNRSRTRLTMHRT